MKLNEAILCVDCESLYSSSSHCPQCGSQVSYPLGRALDRPAVSSGPKWLQPLAALTGRSLLMLRTA